MPKISVIIPIYNPPMHLFIKCLDSIKRQTFTDIEVLLMDSSTDQDIIQIENNYLQLDKRFQRYYIEKTNKFNKTELVEKALNIVTGEYTIIFDSDDELLLTALEILYSFINEDVDIIQCRYIQLKDNELIKPCPNIWPESTQILNYDFFNSLEYSLLIKHLVLSPIHLWNNLIKTNLLKQITFFKYRYHEDLELIWILKFNAKKFQYIPNYLIIHNLYDTSISHEKKHLNKLTDDFFYAYNKIKDFLQKLHIFKRFEKLYTLYYILYAYDFFNFYFTYSEYLDKYTDFLKILAIEIKQLPNISLELSQLGIIVLNIKDRYYTLDISKINNFYQSLFFIK